MRQLAVTKTSIEGLLMISLEVHQDDRGWFKENWQRAKMTALGLPDFGPVQQNIAFNARRGVTRGVHGEPWDKLVSVGVGRVFGAWVDLREGSLNFGQVVTAEIGPETAVFVPRGVANAYQVLEDGTAYSYLVNAHWSAAGRGSYTNVNLRDPALGISWPVPLDQAVLSDSDRSHPFLATVSPVPSRAVVVIGADGQLGQELMAQCPRATGLTLGDFDFKDPDGLDGFGWEGVDTVVNAAAYTAVDLAETPTGRRDCWAVNVSGLSRLVEICRQHRIRLVHVSSDYVFDGQKPVHDEDEAFSPLGVYGQTKAAGDTLVSSLPDYLILRTSWLIGSGPNFVRTMVRLAHDGVRPDVVVDQDGRPTFAQDLAAAAIHLLTVQAPSGVYNVSNAGPVVSWYEIARQVFTLCGLDPDDTRPVTTVDYSAGKPGAAPRPPHSALSLAKLRSVGFDMPDWSLGLPAIVRQANN
ncbi:MAG: bifunctional dTDP-4-dehydrorhamnose 3,5-epimerase family protein/NAD(P)-dependent oxidoreductase [Bifidobacteriaceae bacterium]|jgi:dTDP-4-dehydrorhamnose 3,5-epimerase|nr:bifunctional dTDP-4-dehydrorhamnose 3,5-epimerase family protein/NAD(P)-dependent oxidoreductase [Bifidobacteriaceae bacterium]